MATAVLETTDHGYPKHRPNPNVMRRSKVFLSAALLALIVGSVVFFALPKGPVLAWKVISIRPQGPYWVRDRMEEHCWRVEIEVTNLTADEVIVDWNRDETAFQVGGRWEDLGIGALMPYLGPREARTFPMIIPQEAEACRVRMYYEHGPLWSRADQFLKDHGIYVSEKMFTQGLKANQRLPGHFRRLDIEVKTATQSHKTGQSEGPHNKSTPATPLR